jgi:prepilin-type N-terminal cleavage/methylation domain-containing protein
MLRRGVTLLELLVVLVLMALSAALVVPALSAPTTGALRSDETMNGKLGSGATERMDLGDLAIDPILTSARRLAIRRGEPLRVQIDRDGVWAIVPERGGSAIDGGRTQPPTLWLPDVIVDALGTCVLFAEVVPPPGARAWDAMTCRWRGVP